MKNSRKIIKLESYIFRDALQFRGCRQFEAVQRTYSPSGVNSSPYPSSTDWIESSGVAERSFNNVSAFIVDRRPANKTDPHLASDPEPLLTRSDNPCTITRDSGKLISYFDFVTFLAFGFQMSARR